MDVNGQLEKTTQQQEGQPITVQEPTPAQPVDTPQVVAAPATTPTRPSILVRFRKNLAWTKHLEAIIVPAMVIAVLGFGVFWVTQKMGTDTKSLTIGGFTYSFQYAKAASVVQSSNGMSGYQTDLTHSVMVGPVNNLSELCAAPDPRYSLAFTVQINGDTRPVCKSQDSQGDQEYALSFAAQNHFHEVIVTDGTASYANDNQKLQSIFESIKVSK